MNAIALAVMLSLGQQQTSLLPTYEQPEPELLAPVVEKPLYQRWYVWAAAGTTVAIAVAVIAAVVVSSHHAAPLHQSDFSCSAGAGNCDGWINQPPQ